MRGIRGIRITGIIFSDSILIGAGTTLVSIMTRIFIISTIVARVAVGIKASSMGLVLLKPLDLAILPEPLLLVFVPLRAAGPGARKPEATGRAFVNLRQLLMMRKKSSSSHPTGARSQITQPGRSAIILKAESRSPLFDQLNPLR